jgi:chromosome segregation ATPase
MDWLLVKFLFIAGIAGWFGWFIRSFDVESEKKEHGKTQSKLDKLSEKYANRGREIEQLKREVATKKRNIKALDKHVLNVLGELKQAQKEGRQIRPYEIKRELKKVVNRRYGKQ